MSCRILFLLFTIHFSLFTSFAQQAKDYVDPRIGSVGLGRVFIGPCMPFGMAKPGPDCGVGNNAGWAPMPAAVSGFSQTHVSGTGGGPKYGNILIRPFRGADQHRASETIKLGYYGCTFEESGIQAEVTSARTTAFYRFTFPKDIAPMLEVDLTHFLGRNPVPKAREAQQFEAAHLDSALQNDGLYSYHGYQTISGGWNNGKPYTVYFYTESHQQHAQTLLVKVGISFISEEQAHKNMTVDIPNWDFEATHSSCLNEWQTLLSRLPIKDKASDQVKRMYYTALYHMCLMPTDRQEHTDAPSAPYYDDYYAIWDTYRTSTPLLSLLAPERATAIAQSLLTIYQRDGFLPDARSGNSNGRTQGGSNAEIVLCDAIARQFDIDADLALEAMLKDATVVPADDEAEGRGGLEDYNRLGYVPYGTARAGNRTIEYSFCDWAIAETARMMRERGLSKRWNNDELSAIEKQYMQQSQRWKNLWRSDYEHDGCKGFIMPRDKDGNWLDGLPFGHSQKRQLTFRYTPDVSYEGPWYCKWWDCFMYEASSWEYSFSIPHDIPGLIDMCGGKDRFEARLDTFFAHGYYNVANEPSFLTPLLYHWIGKPEKSTALIQDIIQKNFSDQPNGLPGNDDGGAMSSWLACHLLGEYPMAGTKEWIKYEPISRMQNEDATAATLIAADEKPKGLEIKYSLHGQTRTFYMMPEGTKKGVRMNWMIKRNLKWWHGSFLIPHKAMKRAKCHTYEQPLDGQHITLANDMTFLYLPTKAWQDIQKKGCCTFDNQTWRLIDEEALRLQSDEGAEMEIIEFELQPMIGAMRNNPTEINWEITKSIFEVEKMNKK
ncbi:MAG: glycoside hydrolase family 92 protein [Bacteroidales bacterium]|nr:glycoside hydrolase family 92 protein [Bacteroidales bacterium]